MEPTISLFVRLNDIRNPSISIASSHRHNRPKLTFKEPNRISPSKISSINRQITSSMIVDYKESTEGNEGIRQIMLKNGEEDNKIIFSYIFEREISPQCYQVTYRWIKRSKKIEDSTYLLEEEHVFQGPMLNNCKDGQGQYSIIRRYSDNSENHQIVKGIWSNDILQSGTVVDQNGDEKVITTSNRVKKSTKIIQPFMEKNRTIRFAAMEIKKSSKLIAGNQSKESYSLIINANDGNTYRSGLETRKNHLDIPKFQDS